jgi:hypothetical protein
VNIRITAFAFLFSWTYWLFPVTPSPSALDAGIDTVGFFHRGIRLLVDTRWEQIIFFAAFALGLPILFTIVLDAWKYWRVREVEYNFFCVLAILAFLIVMPFTYLGWEKYFLPVVPLASIYLISVKLSERTQVI